MKTLNDYLAMSYRLEIVRDDAEGGFVASYPDLPGCITCGETEEEAVKNALDAKKVWLEAALEDGLAIPAPDSLEAYSGQFKLRLFGDMGVGGSKLSDPPAPEPWHCAHQVAKTARPAFIA